MTRMLFGGVAVCYLAVVLASTQAPVAAQRPKSPEGKKLFETDTFRGNGRTCLTCHGSGTGTISPQDALQRFTANPDDVLFRHDGSDDGNGNGVVRILRDATILVTIPLAPNVSLADDPAARSVTVARAVASTLNTPALDPVLMLDGRQPTLEDQAAGAIRDHAQGRVPPPDDLRAIADFQKTNAFFSSPALRNFAQGGAAPDLPQGHTASERRGRRFFEDVPPDLSAGLKPGLCSHCHSGPMMNVTNQFAQFFIPSAAPIPAGQRFFNIAVSEFNAAANPVREFIFNAGAANEQHVFSPDLGRAMITGIIDDPTLEHVNAFKISPLRGIRLTAPYFHDNSAKTLEDVTAHYATFFALASGGLINLTEQDQRDIVAFMRLLD
jgi:hypothetical protein